MKRMIDNDLVSTDNGTVQIGTDLEVGGKIHVNQASDIIDKDGKPIAGGGGVKWVPYSHQDLHESILVELNFSVGSQGIDSYFTTTYDENYGRCISIYGQAGSFIGLANVYPSQDEHYTVYKILKITTNGIESIPTSDSTCTISRVLVKE